MKRNNKSDLTEEGTHQLDQRKERARQHLILIADLSALIVKELRMVSDGVFKTDIIKRFPDYSIQQIEDAIESAIEDEYIELVEQNGNLLCYRAIQYDEDW